MKKPNLFNKISPKWFVLGAFLAAGVAIGGFHFLQTKPQKIQVNGVAYQTPNLKTAKLKNLFYNIQKNPNDAQELTENLGTLTQEELDQGYKTAVKTFQYNLAISFYEQGAQDCYESGEDILLVAINSGRIDLVQDLLKKEYPIELYHLNAARSLVNIDQSNWAYIFGQRDTDDLGYQKYLIESQKVASQVISLYRAQNPITSISYDTSASHIENYRLVHGQNSVTEFHNQMQEVLKGEFAIETAVHGTQHTPIIVNAKGEKVAIIKSKNELLAYALDYDHFAGVPPAVEVQVPKLGKVVVQKWVPDTVMASEVKQSSDKNSEQLHHIRVLDIRLGNSDRNPANILMTQREGKPITVPIDHDLIGHYIPNDTDWEAGYLNAPFSPACKKYVASIDLEKDALVMEQLGYSQEDIKTMKLRTTLLKMASERNLTLKETDMLYRYYYYDFLDHSESITAQSSEKEIRSIHDARMNHVSQTVQDPVEVWGLMGNSYELYI